MSLDRLAGSVTRFVISLGFVSAEDARATFAVPEIVKARAERPVSQHAVGEPETVLAEVVRSVVVQPAAVR